MNFNVPLQTECTVTGVLRFVLLVSRIFGLAPIIFENGARIRVSRICSLYGQVLTIILMSSSTVAFVGDLTINAENSLRTKTNSNLFLWAADLVLVDMVIFIGAVTGTYRMRTLINCTAHLKQINKELSLYHQSPSSSEIKIWLLVNFFIFLGCFVNGIDYIVLIIEVINTNGNVLTSSFYIGHNVLCFVLIIFVIQFSVTILSVLPSFKALNCCLIKIYRDNKDINKYGHTYRNTSVKTSVTLHRLTILYCSLCDIVRQLNDCNGFILAVLFLTILLHLIITLYHLIIGFFADNAYSDHSNAPLQLAWSLYQLIKITMVIEPCHRTHEEIKLTKTLVNKMRLYTLPDDFTVASKLKIFYRHIMLNEVAYSPMQLFAINRSLIAAVIGGITTYLMIVTQL